MVYCGSEEGVSFHALLANNAVAYVFRNSSKSVASKSRHQNSRLYFSITHTLLMPP